MNNVKRHRLLLVTYLGSSNQAAEDLSKLFSGNKKILRHSEQVYVTQDRNNFVVGDDNILKKYIA